MITLGVQSIGRHYRPGQIEGFQQSGEAGDLIRFVRHPQLSNGPAVAGHRGEQVRGRLVAVSGTAGTLAVCGHRGGPGGSGLV